MSPIKTAALAVKYSEMLFEMQKDLTKEGECEQAACDVGMNASWLQDCEDLSESDASAIAAAMAALVAEGMFPSGVTHTIATVGSDDGTAFEISLLSGELLAKLSIAGNYNEEAFNSLITYLATAYPNAYWI
jgi:hypothetical protein